MRNSMIVAVTLMALTPVMGYAGEYDDNCATGLAIYEVMVKTDCSVNWTDEKSGKTYCFSSENTKQEFLEDIATNIRKAEEKYAELTAI